jgi:hypothetical protein
MYVHLQSETLKWTLPITVAIFFGLIGAVFTWAKDWSAAARRSRLLDQATKRVEFWTRWLDAVKVHGIATTTEQVAAAHSELSKTADVIHEALRFWPLPQKWTPQDFRARWEKLWIIRRLFMLYDLHDRRARWERLALYAIALGICSIGVARAFDHRPDSTLVYVYRGGGPPGVPAPEGLDGFETTLGNARREARFNDCALVFMLVGARFVIFIREWRWMMPLSADPEWIRRPRARFYKKIAEQNGGTLPRGIFSHGMSITEIEGEIEWLAEGVHPAPDSQT